MSEKKYKIAAILSGLSLLVLGSFFAYKKYQHNKANEFYNDLDKNLNIEANNSTELDSNYLNDLKKTGTLLTDTQAKDYAKQLSDSWNLFGTSEEIVFSVLRKLKSKAQIAQVGSELYKLEEVDLTAFLKEMGETDYKTALEIINSKPEIYT